VSDCCSSSGAIPKKYRCPVCDRENSEVSVTTILHHIKTPWQWLLKDQGHYFCDNPECTVVYFAQDNTVFNTEALRTIVGIKSQAKDALICYCFGVSIDACNQPEARGFVIKQTRLHNCACAIRNPSGRCCLKDFPEKM